MFFTLPLYIPSAEWQNTGTITSISRKIRECTVKTSTPTVPEFETADLKSFYTVNVTYKRGGIILYLLSTCMSVCPFVRMAPPAPSPPSECVLPGTKGGATLAWGSKGGRSQFGRLERKPGTLYTLYIININFLLLFHIVVFLSAFYIYSSDTSIIVLSDEVSALHVRISSNVRLIHRINKS